MLEDVKKSTLIIKFGLYDWTVMPFGMKNATSTFTRTMTKIFGVYMDRFLKVFVDDLNIHILTWDEHFEHIHSVLMELREVKFKLNPTKCEFAKANIRFLRHVVSRKGTQPN